MPQSEAFWRTNGHEVDYSATHIGGSNVCDPRIYPRCGDDSSEWNMNQWARMVWKQGIMNILEPRL